MSNIRWYFCSRYGDAGKLLELDYSQLEIYTLAFLSGDKTLKSDLLSGKDLHAISAEALFGKGFTPHQRKIAKTLSFQLQYGAGAASMAKKNNISKLVAKKFIDNYYNRYPTVREWQDEVLKDVNSRRRVDPKGRRTKSGIPAGICKINSPTNRRYTFLEHDAPEWLHDAAVTSFSPTQAKNYPVQGFATGDIVPMMLGILHNKLNEFNREKFRDGTPEYKYHPVPTLLVGTVHDSVLFDCPSSQSAMEWGLIAKEEMEKAPKYLKSIFNIDFDLPLPVEAKWGKNWHDMKDVDLTIPF